MASGKIGRASASASAEVVSKSVGGLISQPDAITGRTNNATVAVEYSGVDTATTSTAVDNKERTIAVDVKQSVLDAKQDAIRFVTLSDDTGTLDAEMLNLLTVQRVNRIVHGTSVYNLSRVDGNEYVYISQRLDSSGATASVYEIRIDASTGAYASKTLVQDYVSLPVFRAHANDTDIHVRSGEREFWNSKATVDEGSERLTLTASRQ